MDPKVQDALLQDPRVRAAVQKAGQEALSDPQVQQQILDISRQKFPEVAAAVQQQLVQWANDPEVQRRACEVAGVARLYAGHAVDYAGQAAGQAGDQFLKIIEQGPTGIRILAFFGGAASCANAMFMMSDFLKILTDPMRYLLFLYQVMFSVTTIIFEAKPEWIAQIPVVSEYQDLVIAKAQFLSEVAGRGMFYGFQGSLWLYYASPEQLQHLVLGLYFFLLCAFHLSMHVGIMPQHIAQKIREGGYVPLPLTAGEANGHQYGVVEATPSTTGLIKETDGARSNVTVAEALGTMQPFAEVAPSGLELEKQRSPASPPAQTSHEGNPESTKRASLLDVDEYPVLLNSQKPPEVSQERMTSREMVLQPQTENAPAIDPFINKKKTQQKCCNVM